jgi:hypothetical protein
MAGLTGRTAQLQEVILEIDDKRSALADRT